MPYDATRSNPGWANGASGTYALDNANFLKVFTGEVLAAYSQVNVMSALHRMRTIDHGKSAQFVLMGRAAARYHVPGQNILGSNVIKQGERVINIDDLLIADVFLYDLDDAKNHFDVRQEYSRQLGIALANAFDSKTMRVAILAARSAGVIADDAGGSVLTNASFATDGPTLASGIFKCAQTWDEKFVPEEDRNVIIKPAQYYLLAQTTDVLNKEWGGSGAYAEGTVLKVGGVTLVKSANVPNTVVSAVSGENNTYNGDFSKTVAVAIQREAIGTVKLKDLAVQKSGSDFNVMYQGDLMVAKYAMGHGILRASSAIELASA